MQLPARPAPQPHYRPAVVTLLLKVAPGDEGTEVIGAVLFIGLGKLGQKGELAVAKREVGGGIETVEIGRTMLGTSIEELQDNRYCGGRPRTTAPERDRR